ncbi:hypothetical protein PSTG_03587 [Puccinia striiformis f. sp. tritici PST-78]|uniref:Uncharacterized protein n=1 Tax=Puccinia striiformis f. sp. tritici PST-78 TaxID=1165861 RepID=A0A0L0VWD0_9BASI|nr:hypothetical protein PSTG_03587 [Puccinia striiformis f. sp. tritici PST-78]
MADSTPEPLAELEYVRLGDLAARGFKRLSEKYREPTGQDGDATLSESQTLSIDETIASKEKRLNDLQFHLLPALHLQFADLSNLLRPSCLQVVDMLRILRAQFLAAFPFIFLIFCDAFRLLIDLTINPEPFKTSPHFPGDYLIEETFYYIDWTIECIKGSELDLAQCFWRLDLKNFDYMLVDVRMLVDSHTYYKIGIAKEPTQKLVSEPVIQLANVGTTLIKLCKLFFTKLSTRWMNRKRLPYSTEMSSEQIESLAQSIRDVTGDLGDLIALFRIADQEMIDDRAELSQGFLNIGTWLKSRFDPPLLAILLYLLPIIPETHLGFPNQDYYKDWFVTWNTQRILVTEHFINLAKSLGNDP